MTSSDRPSGPVPDITPAHGYSRPGIVYIDDSPTACCRPCVGALYPHGLLLETFTSLADFRTRDQLPVIGVLLDVDLGHAESGFDVAQAILADHPTAAVAFLTAEPMRARARKLASWGPLFAKADIKPAVDWLVELVRERRLVRIQSR